MSLIGRARKFGENINTDLIFPKRYFKPKYEQGEMASHLMTGVDPDFPKTVKKGDVIVGGPNFGCGSSREEAPGSMKEAGIAAVLAPTFGRIFLRNCVNLGVPAIYCPGIDENVEEGDELEVDLVEGLVMNRTNGFEARIVPLAPELLKLINEGGIADYTRRVLAERQTTPIEKVGSDQDGE